MTDDLARLREAAVRGDHDGEDSLSGQEHWNTVYRAKAPDEVSWFQARPETSLRLLSSVARPGSGVIDIGGGVSTLTDVLLGAGWRDVTVLDISIEALEAVRGRLGERLVSLVLADVLWWQPQRRYDVWHDRAVFHFLVEPAQQERYVATASSAVEPGGAVVLGTFAADGPTCCSGLPTARYAADQLARVFAPAFRMTHHERDEHVTPGGTVQPFTWVVLHRT